MESQFVNSLIYTFDDDTFINLDIWKKNLSSGSTLNISYYAIDCEKQSILFKIDKVFLNYKHILDYEYKDLVPVINNTLAKFATE